jgi:hypothetical protein
VRTDFDIASYLKGSNLLTYKKIGGGIRVRPEIVKFVRDQGFRKIFPEVYGLIFRGKNFSYNADIGRIGHLWMGTMLF